MASNSFSIYAKRRLYTILSRRVRHVRTPPLQSRMNIDIDGTFDWLSKKDQRLLRSQLSNFRSAKLFSLDIICTPTTIVSSTAAITITNKAFTHVLSSSRISLKRNVMKTQCDKQKQNS